MTDYWLSKLLYDLQTPSEMARWKADPAAVLRDYPLQPALRQAVIDDDLAAIALHVNAYLLRFHFSAIGMTDAELLERLHALKPEEDTRNG